MKVMAKMMPILLCGLLLAGCGQQQATAPKQTLSAELKTESPAAVSPEVSLDENPKNGMADFEVTTPGQTLPTEPQAENSVPSKEALEEAPKSGTVDFMAMIVHDLDNYDWELRDYPDLDSFLLECGVGNTPPSFAYYDQDGNVQLELYYNEDTETGCGIRYVRYDNGELSPFGFAFEQIFQFGRDQGDEWAQWDRWKMDYTAIPSWNDLDGVDGYQEDYQYDEAGRVTQFVAFGYVYGAEELIQIGSIQFTYDENGTLRERKFGKNQMLFPSNDSMWYTYFDGQGRVCYEYGYLTHGSQEYYYIYTDNSIEPAYCLYLDNDCGIWRPAFMRLKEQ